MNSDEEECEDSEQGPGADDDEERSASDALRELWEDIQDEAVRRSPLPPDDTKYVLFLTVAATVGSIICVIAYLVFGLCTGHPPLILFAPIMLLLLLVTAASNM